MWLSDWDIGKMEAVEQKQGFGTEFFGHVQRCYRVYAGSMEVGEGRRIWTDGFDVSRGCGPARGATG